METIGYLHLASAYEASESIEVVPVRVNFKFFENWKKLSSGAAMRLLPVALSLAVLSVAGQALAVQRVGSRGPEVSNIQRCLTRLGLYNGPVNGNFGSLTKNAVIRYQQRNRLVADGVVGAGTQRLLQSQCQGRTPGNPGGVVSGDLRLGSSGERVTQLQQNLRQLGFFNGSITGHFGSATQQAVIRFQQYYGMRADGVVGNRTQQTIITALYNTPSGGIGGEPIPSSLGLGSSGPLVTELQDDLRRLRYLNTISTGYYGPVTRDAVARFQRDYGIAATGTADSRTLAAISSALQSELPSNTGCQNDGGNLCEGETSQRVVALQQRLQQHGFFRGNITGYFGPATREAVIQFQRNYGFNPTGVVDFQTWQALGLSDSQVGNRPSRNRYVVVVPIYNPDTLFKVRQLVPEAFAAKSRLGDYVNAGEFPTREDAERRTRALRSSDLDARVEYF